MMFEKYLEVHKSSNPTLSAIQLGIRNKNANTVIVTQESDQIRSVKRWFLKSRINRWEAGCRARAQHSPEISPERSRKQFISLLSNYQRITLFWYVLIIMTLPSTLRWRRAFKTKPSSSQQFWSVFSSISIHMQVLIYSHIYMDIFITCIFSFSPLE